MVYTLVQTNPACDNDWILHWKLCLCLPGVFSVHNINIPIAMRLLGAFMKRIRKRIMIGMFSTVYDNLIFIVSIGIISFGCNVCIFANRTSLCPTSKDFVVEITLYKSIFF